MSDEQLAAGEIEYDDEYPAPDSDEYERSIDPTEYIDPTEPLDEETDVTALDPNYPLEVSPRDPLHRRLRAIAGAGVPYVFLVFPDGDRVEMDFAGVKTEDLAELLAVTADSISAAQIGATL